MIGNLTHQPVVIYREIRETETGDIVYDHGNEYMARVQNHPTITADDRGLGVDATTTIYTESGPLPARVMALTPADGRKHPSLTVTNYYGQLGDYQYTRITCQ